MSIISSSVLYQFTVQFRQVVGEVVHNLTLRFIEFGIDAVDKSITTQTLLNGFADVEQGLLNTFNSLPAW